VVFISDCKDTHFQWDKKTFSLLFSKNLFFYDLKPLPEPIFGSKEGLFRGFHAAIPAEGHQYP
jgi:hypothetical protein